MRKTETRTKLEMFSMHKSIEALRKKLGREPSVLEIINSINKKEATNEKEKV